MQYKHYVPKILLCGDTAEFLSKVAQRPFKIVGQLQIFGEVDGQKFNLNKDGKVFFNDKLQDFDALKDFLKSNAVDYLVFVERKIFQRYHEYGYFHDFIYPKSVTLEQFNNMPLEFFFDPNAPLRMITWMKFLKIKTALDVDAFFAKSKIFTKPSNDLTEIDCVTEETLPPIAENIYHRVYKNLAEVGHKRYDAVILAERTPIEFDGAYLQLENFSDNLLIFMRTDSPLQEHFVKNSKRFARGEGLRMETGSLFHLKRRKPPEDFCMYVVTHKATPHEGKLPDGYKTIHAGHAQATEDFGYAGDDTGDNISDLNLYINEITALYWIWKNTAHTTVGLCHYRRFFTTGDEKFSYDKILTRDDALKILETHDIIVAKTFHGVMNQREFVENDCGEKLAHFGEAILRKHLLHAQPEYLDALDYVMNSKAVYKCNMFVTRREVLDAFCTWLFSFLLDATREALQTFHLENLPWTPRRLMSFLAERMLHVWLMRQRIRIKELDFMFIDSL